MMYRLLCGWRILHIIISFEDRRGEPFSRNVLSGSAPAGTDDTYKLYYDVYIYIQYDVCIGSGQKVRLTN